MPPQHGRTQVTPPIFIAARRWRRNLLQYGEIYNPAFKGVGLLLPAGLQQHKVLGINIKLGRQHRASLCVPALAFDKNPGLSPTRRLNLMATYRMSQRFALTAKLARPSWSNGASESNIGFYEPPSQTRQRELGLVLDWFY